MCIIVCDQWFDVIYYSLLLLLLLLLLWGGEREGEREKEDKQ